MQRIQRFALTRAFARHAAKYRLFARFSINSFSLKRPAEKGFRLVYCEVDLKLSMPVTPYKMVLSSESCCCLKTGKWCLLGRRDSGWDSTPFIGDRRESRASTQQSATDAVLWRPDRAQCPRPIGLSRC